MEIVLIIVGIKTGLSKYYQQRQENIIIFSLPGKIFVDFVPRLTINLKL